MSTWPLIQRNKVEDSKINVPVGILAQSDNEGLASLAKKVRLASLSLSVCDPNRIPLQLLAQWETLEYAYRIPKRVKGDDEEVSAQQVIVFNHDEDERPSKRSRPEEEYPRFVLPSESMPRPKTPPPIDYVVERSLYQKELMQREAEARRQQEVAAIIARAAKAAEEASKPKPPPQTSTVDSLFGLLPKPQAIKDWDRKKSSSSSKHKRPHQSKEEREANKEKRLLKLIGAVVVKCMSKYKDQMDHDQFKKYAKEVRTSRCYVGKVADSSSLYQLTHVIAEKEKKSQSYKDGKLDALSEEKTSKIKKFSKEYIAKVLRKLEKSGKRRKPVSTAGSSSTPDSRLDNDDTVVPAATVDEVMGFDAQDDNDNGDLNGDDWHNGADDDCHREDGGVSGSGSPDDVVSGSGQTSPTLVSDPRIRPDSVPDKLDLQLKSTSQVHYTKPKAHYENVHDASW